MLRLISVKQREGGEGKGEEEDEKSPAPAQQHEVEGVQVLQAGKWLSWAIPSTVEIPREEGEVGTRLIPPVGLLHPLGTLSPKLKPKRQGLESPQAIV